MPEDWPESTTPELAVLLIEDPDDQAIVEEGFRARQWKVRVEHDAGTALGLLLQDRVRTIVTDDLDFVELVGKGFLEQTAEGAVYDGPQIVYIAVPGHETPDGLDLVLVGSPVNVDDLFRMLEAE